MASAETDGYAGLSGKSFRFSVISVFLIQKKKDPVVILKRFLGKLFFGDPDSDLSHKNQRFLLIFYQFSDGILKIQICFRMQGIPEPDNAAFGNFDSLDHIKPGIHGIPELFQAMVDLSGDQLQLFLFLAQRLCIILCMLQKLLLRFLLHLRYIM